MGHSSSTAAAWQQDIFKVLDEGGVRQIVYVPESGHFHVIRSSIADPDIEDIVLTTEEEGIAVVSGAWLGGQRAVLLMQSSGVGNCVNMFSLLTSANFPFLTLVTMRGEYADFNPWQGPDRPRDAGRARAHGHHRAARIGPGAGRRDRPGGLRRRLRGLRPGRRAAGLGPAQARTVCVNTYRAASFMAPFGGYKDSGLGRKNGIGAMREYLQTKSAWINAGAATGNPFVMR